VDEFINWSGCSIWNIIYMDVVGVFANMEYRPKVVKDGLEYYVCWMVYNDLLKAGNPIDAQVVRGNTKLPLYLPKNRGLDYCNNNMCKNFEECPAYDAMLEDKIIEMKLMLGVRQELKEAIDSETSSQTKQHK